MSKIDWEKDKKKRLPKQKMTLESAKKDEQEEFVGMDYVITDMNGAPLPLNPPLHKLNKFPRQIRLALLKLNDVRKLIRQVRSSDFMQEPADEKLKVILDLISVDDELFNLDLDVIRGYVLGREYREVNRIKEQYALLLLKNIDDRPRL